VPGFFATFYNYAFVMPKTAGLKSPVYIVCRFYLENTGGVYTAGIMLLQKLWGVRISPTRPAGRWAGYE
jgi:hypothetical protein